MAGSESKHLTYFALMEELEGTGCALCALVLRALERYFDGLVYAKVNDLGIRETLRASHAFCAAHGEMLRQARSALGSAIIHRDVLNSIARQLECASPPAKSPIDWLQAAFDSRQPQENAFLPAEERCPACLHARRAEHNYVNTLLANWNNDELRAAFRRSSGLCVPHLRMVLGGTNDKDTFETIQAIQLEIWQDLIGELDEFIRKQDFRFSQEPKGSERDSWSRAIDLVSGLWQVGGSPSPW
jgi:hypothetical protein